MTLGSWGCEKVYGMTKRPMPVIGFKQIQLTILRFLAAPWMTRKVHLAAIFALMLSSIPARIDSYSIQCYSHAQTRCSVAMIRDNYGETNARPKRDFKTLQPIPCTGVFTLPDGARSASVFLAPRKMQVEQYDDSGTVLVNDVLPILIKTDIESAMIAAGAETKTSSKSATSSALGREWSRGTLTDRNYGFFDGLLDLPFFEEVTVSSIDRAILRVSPDPAETASRTVIPRKQLYSYIHRGPGATADADAGAQGQGKVSQRDASPYHAMAEALRDLAGLKITGLLLEVK
jgi:hypothetical protein